MILASGGSSPTRHLTAVYGGSKSLIDPVVRRYMFGNTYPIFDAQGIVSEYVRNPDLAEYVRWEYRPADRSSVIRSIKRRRTTTRQVPFAGAARIARRIRAWVKDLRETTGGPIESGLMYRAMLCEKVL